MELSRLEAAEAGQSAVIQGNMRNTENKDKREERELTGRRGDDIQ